jgi:hypothetical protein
MKKKPVNHPTGEKQQDQTLLFTRPRSRLSLLIPKNHKSVLTAAFREMRLFKDEFLVRIAPKP